MYYFHLSIRTFTFFYPNEVKKKTNALHNIIKLIQDNHYNCKILFVKYIVKLIALNKKGII